MDGVVDCRRYGGVDCGVEVDGKGFLDGLGDEFRDCNLLDLLLLRLLPLSLLRTALQSSAVMFGGDGRDQMRIRPWEKLHVGWVRGQADEMRIFCKENDEQAANGTRCERNRAICMLDNFVLNCIV